MSPIAHFTQEIIDLLELPCEAGTPIYLGASNIEHMKQRHPKDYNQYSPILPDILNHPDYVGLNPKDKSVEFVKEVQVGEEYIKAAVRIALSGKYYARSLYLLQNNRVKNFIAKGTLKSLTNPSK